MSTTAEQGKAKYHASVGAGRGTTGDSFRLTWTAKLRAESAAIQTAPWDLETSHVGWRKEAAIGQESTWMCHKWRMQLISWALSPPLFFPPFSVLYQILNQKFEQ